MNRELDQTLQRNLERLYNYLENPEREEAQRVLLAAEPEPIRITHGIPDKSRTRGGTACSARSGTRAYPNYSRNS